MPHDDKADRPLRNRKAVNLQADTINKAITKILPLFLILVFIATVKCSIHYYSLHHPWNIGDWLINYQGGIVRRGIVGETIYDLSLLTHLNPGVWVVICQVVSYAIFLLFSYLVLRKEGRLYLYAFLIFSPYIFSFQVNDPGGGFRKEILYFALLSFITWTSLLKNRKRFYHIFTISCVLIYPLIVLSHEMMIVFLPYLLFIYTYHVSENHKNSNKKLLLQLFMLSLPSIISFLISLRYHGTESQVKSIFASLNAVGYPIKDGAISWVSKSIHDAIETTKIVARMFHYWLYSLLILLSLLAFVPIRSRLRYILFSNPLRSVLILLSITGTIALSIVALDWGRLVRINLVSIFLISLLHTEGCENVSKQINNQDGKIKIVWVVIFLLYALLWHLPHASTAGGIGRSLKELNYIRYFTNPPCN